ncbi:MAG: uroporphyrinogen decarboxylase family protein [Fimbriimonas sp.]|nr:uroporphyrinogen decarboxylase family protein [Fimbriimonas sp.]
MTQRENFHRMMRGQVYEHVPFDLPMTPPIVDEMERRMGMRDPVEAFDLDFRYVWGGGHSDADQWRAEYERRGVPIPKGAWVGNGGYCELPGDKDSVGDAYHLTYMFHPLSYSETLEEIETFPWHDLNDPALYAPVAGRVAETKAAGKVATLGLECSVFESAWYLRSMEQIYCDLAEENGIADWLFDRYAEQSTRMALAGAQAGADLIRLGDDVGTQRGMMMSVPFWRKHLKPRLARIVEAAKTVENPPYVQYHSDGRINEIVDDLIEIGVDILNPVQPECMPIDEVADRWKDRIAFCGMIGTQTTMPFGSEDDVRAQVAGCEKWIHLGAKMVLAPTHVLEPDVPWQNVIALANAVRAIKV